MPEQRDVAAFLDELEVTEGELGDADSQNR